jgi:hypothetical protein
MRLNVAENKMLKTMKTTLNPRTKLAVPATKRGFVP